MLSLRCAGPALAFVVFGSTLLVARAQAPLPPDANMPCIERAITIPTTDDLKLPGKLTLPPAKDSAAPHIPVAVLEQGSGVQDMDATIGANKFFVQLAQGLCRRGVATIRFNRRAMVAPANFKAHADLDHEVVIDAASALAFAQTLPDVDPHRVFLVGHSLGAQLGPDSVALRLTQKPGSVAGLALLSGVARPIAQVLDEQIATLGKAQGGTPEQISQMRQMWAAVFTEANDPATPADKPLGLGAKIPASYWRDWSRRDPVAALSTLHLPVLVTRGTKDVNSTHADFEKLKAAATATGSDALEFPGLGHTYMPVDGEPKGSDMMMAGEVSSGFLDYLGSWLRNPATATR